MVVDTDTRPLHMYLSSTGMDSRRQDLMSWRCPGVLVPRFYMPAHITQGHKQRVSQVACGACLVLLTDNRGPPRDI